MGKHLVLVGGGHAHMVTLANLSEFINRGHKVTVVGSSPHHYYSGMGPGMLGRSYAPEEIRFATRRIVQEQGAEFVQGEAVRVDPAAHTLLLKSGETIPYDVLSFNTGSFVPKTHVMMDGPDIYTVKPIEKLLKAQQRILALIAGTKISIAIVGGGPSSVEIAGNIWRLSKGAIDPPNITIFSGRKLMQRFPAGLRRKALQSLRKRGINVFEDSHVREIQKHKVLLESGRVYSADIIFLAVGVEPSPIFRQSGLPTGPDGGLEVNRYLQSTSHPELFGGGDCIYFKDHPLDKVGVYAVRQNPVLFHNLMAALEGTALKPFDPGGDYMLIFNMGDGTGILQKRWLMFGGRLAFFIKDRIDRKFMKQFQSVEK